MSCGCEQREAPPWREIYWRLSELFVLLPLTGRGQTRSRDFARITVDGDPVVLAADD